MSNKPLAPKEKTAFGLFFIGIGVMTILVSADIIKVEDCSFHVARWVVSVCGIIFALAGIMVLLGEKSKWNNLLAGVLILSMGTVGGWIALFGESDGFSGGIPLLSNGVNTWLARGMFGIGALICLFIAFYALKLHLKSKKK